jgi:hypothetical protein
MNESLFEKIFKVHCSKQEGPKATNGIKECTIHLCVYFHYYAPKYVHK